MTFLAEQSLTWEKQITPSRGLLQTHQSKRSVQSLNGSTYWPKQKASPVGEDDEQQEVQGAVGEMYTGQLATVFSGFH